MIYDEFEKEMIATREARQEIRNIKEKAEALMQALNDLSVVFNTSREREIAKTKLEECVMWATKSIIRNYYFYEQFKGAAETIVLSTKS